MIKKELLGIQWLLFVVLLGDLDLVRKKVFREELYLFSIVDNFEKICFEKSCIFECFYHEVQLFLNRIFISKYGKYNCS